MPHLRSLGLVQCGLTDLSAPQLERLLSLAGRMPAPAPAAHSPPVLSDVADGAPPALLARSSTMAAPPSAGGGAVRGAATAAPRNSAASVASASAAPAPSLSSLAAGAATSTGGSPLLAAASAAPGLTDLDLSLNNLGPKAVGALALALPRVSYAEPLQATGDSSGSVYQGCRG
jgi:hypothetical protein